MQSFHNNSAVKNKYVDRVIAHQKADNLIRGTGWEDGKGCAVGCTLENYDHKAYEDELGLPEWLARLEDTLFEGMSEEKSRTWPEVFLKAIPEGVSEETFEREVKAPFLIAVLNSALETFDHKEYPDVKAAIGQSITLWEREDIGSGAFLKAAEAAVEAAEAAARSVARSAARSVARSAEAAKYDRFADELLALFAELEKE